MRLFIAKISVCHKCLTPLDCVDVWDSSLSYFSGQFYQTFLNAVLFVAKCHFNAFGTKSVPNWARVIFMVSAHTLPKQSVYLNCIWCLFLAPPASCQQPIVVSYLNPSRNTLDTLWTFRICTLRCSFRYGWFHFWDRQLSCRKWNTVGQINCNMYLDFILGTASE